MLLYMLLCPQKQCLRGKADGLSGRTNQRLPCVKGADAVGGWGIVLRWIFCFYNPSVSLARATSLYTREAHHRPTVHLKGVTHYTFQSKACEKEYEQIVRTPFVVGRGFISRRFLCIYRLFSAAASHRPTRLRQVKPALWKAPLQGSFWFKGKYSKTE